MKIFSYSLILLYFTVTFAKYIGNRFGRQVPKCIKNCILLRDCDPFLEQLRTSEVLARERIKSNQCGREGLRIKVCCPEKPSIQKSYFPHDCGNNPAVASKIFLGNLTKMGEFPWIAAIEYKKPKTNKTRLLCAGTLINARYVLTAAHCLDRKKLNRYELHSIRLGDWNLSSIEDCFEGQNGMVCAPPFIAARPERMISHPTYDIESINSDDIALIRLDRTIDFRRAKGFIMPICLPSFGVQAELLKRDRDPIVIGWGETEKKDFSPVLLRAEVPFASRKDCEKLFAKNYGERQLCVGGNERDSCYGDSGGPLMLSGPKGPPYLQIGIISFGKNCGSLGNPAVYTSVQHYKDWIFNQLEPWDE